MASRSRARGYALQMLYCSDIHAEGFSSRLHQMEQAISSDEEWTSEGLKELLYRQSLEKNPSSAWSELRKESVRGMFVLGVQGSILPLYHAQLELPEEWYHEQRLNEAKEIERYRSYLHDNIEPMDAFRLVTDSEFSNLFDFFCRQTRKMLENQELYSPSVVAHWLLREPQLQELINLEIDWTPLFDTLCFLQSGWISDLSARILLRRIRKEYDPSNKEERRTASDLAEGNKGKSLLHAQVGFQSLSRENEGLLNVHRHPAEPEEIAYTQLLLNGIAESIEYIDSLITSASKFWEIERMSMIDRNILRLGCFELVYQESVPSRVVINEAINLTKCFSGSSEVKSNHRGGGYSDGVKFVNGILDKIARDIGKSDLSQKKR